MKITLQRGDLLCHPNSVFVKVTPPATATTQPQAAYVSDWAGVAREILTDTPIAPEPEPCQAKLCLNSTKAALHRGEPALPETGRLYPAERRMEREGPTVARNRW